MSAKHVNSQTAVNACFAAIWLSLEARAEGSKLVKTEGTFVCSLYGRDSCRICITC